jgi:hypothetical protein
MPSECLQKPLGMNRIIIKNIECGVRRLAITGECDHDHRVASGLIATLLALDFH